MYVSKKCNEITSIRSLVYKRENNIVAIVTILDEAFAVVVDVVVTALSPTDAVAEEEMWSTPLNLTLDVVVVL